MEASLTRPLSLLAALVLFVTMPVPIGAADLRPEEIVTLLPKDRIPAILSPKFDEGHRVSWIAGEKAVIGIEIGGDSRAYPVAVLSSHEIVNDKVGGVPIVVTW